MMINWLKFLYKNWDTETRTCSQSAVSGTYEVTAACWHTGQRGMNPDNAFAPRDIPGCLEPDHRIPRSKITPWKEHRTLGKGSFLVLRTPPTPHPEMKCCTYSAPLDEHHFTALERACLASNATWKNRSSTSFTIIIRNGVTQNSPKKRRPIAPTAAMNHDDVAAVVHSHTKPQGSGGCPALPESRRHRDAFEGNGEANWRDSWRNLKHRTIVVVSQSSCLQ